MGGGEKEREKVEEMGRVGRRWREVWEEVERGGGGEVAEDLFVGWSDGGVAGGGSIYS